MASIAHIGYGYWGKNIARNFAELGLLAAIVDPHPASAEAGAKAHDVRAASFAEVLADKSIDGVSIAAPAELHFKLASAALNAGKHVFVEKPLTIDVGEAEALCALADKAGLTLMVGHLLQYHPVYVKLREMVAAGELGRLLYVYSNRQSLGKFRREENVLWSFAPHDISMILGLVGEDEADAGAGGTGAAGAADAVHIGLAVLGGVVVDHPGDVGDVDAAGGDVGGDERHHVAALEPGQRLLALALALVAVHCDRLDALAAEPLDEAVGAALGADEDERAAGAVLGQVLHQVGELGPLGVDRDEAVLDLRLGVGRLGVRVRAGAVGVGGGDTARRPLEGGREEERLAVGRGAVDEPVDGGPEAHVEHPVGLVEDEHADAPERDRPAADQVLEPPGGGDEDVGAAGGLDLRA